MLPEGFNNANEICFDLNGDLYVTCWESPAKIVKFSFPTLSVPISSTEIPLNYLLFQNYPNPFNPNTTIEYQLPRRSSVLLKIYNVLGQEVRTLVDEIQDAGYKSVVWHSTSNYGNPVSSGVYFYRLQAGEFIETRKLMLLR